ncbi:MAG UNVERIFIED_CONTAM: hypothetical protein LVT10_20265 [Anaerolineae bacterium]|jgi:hypothetical protein
MEIRCLDKNNLARIVDIVLYGKSFYEDEAELEFLLDRWKDWDIELIFLSTSLLQILEARQKKSEDAMMFLEKFNELYDSGLLNIEYFSESFIKYMFGFPRQSDLSIEENLLEIRRNFAEYKY